MGDLKNESKVKLNLEGFYNNNSKTEFQSKNLESLARHSSAEAKETMSINSSTES